MFEQFLCNENTAVSAPTLVGNVWHCYAVLSPLLKVLTLTRIYQLVDEWYPFMGAAVRLSEEMVWYV
jgi:hypothetical protein